MTQKTRVDLTDLMEDAHHDEDAEEAQEKDEEPVPPGDAKGQPVLYGEERKTW